jgi:magnesium chelatase subunit D
VNGPGEMSPASRPPDPFAEALVAARLCALDPGLGGMILRGGGSLCDRVVAEVRARLPSAAPVRRVPVHIDDDRLLGGIDLTAALARGVVHRRVGLFAEAQGGIVVVPMAERMSEATAGRLAAAMDGGLVADDCQGAPGGARAPFLTIALDEGIEPDEQVPAPVAERAAFWLDLSATRYRDGESPSSAPENDGGPAIAEPQLLERIAMASAVLGIDSARASLFALKACRASAHLAGRPRVAEADLALALRLVLAPRATRIPAAATPPPSETTPPSADRDGHDAADGDGEPPSDVVLAAARAALPDDVLARIAAGGVGRRRPTRASGAGERRTSGARGRPLAARAGMPDGGRRLSLIETLRAAAPWQRLRGAEGRVLVRRADLRVRRFVTRAEAVTIFLVDASGSSALARLAEAKGAVELLLAEAYVRRAQVALIAFRGTSAELLLPPTRSLTRARRCLAELPGGGGTPLAAGLRAAHDLAETVRARGRTPFLVVLTDGRANIAADGRAVRKAAAEDAQAAARAIGGADIGSAFLDISARPGPEAAALAAAMRARYLPLPRADAATMHAAVRVAQGG